MAPLSHKLDYKSCKYWNKKIGFSTSALLSYFRSNFPGQWHQVIGSALGYPGGVQWIQDVSTSVLTPHFVSLQLHSLCEPCESRVEFDSHWMHPINNVKKSQFKEVFSNPLGVKRLTRRYILRIAIFLGSKKKFKRKNK